MEDPAMLVELSGPLSGPWAEIAPETTLRRSVFEDRAEDLLGLCGVAEFERVDSAHDRGSMVHDVRCAEMNARMSSGAMSRRRPIRTVGSAPE